ncbi:hypothetical protein [Spirosoma pomorum]
MPVALLLFLPLLTSLGNGLAKGADNAAQGKYNKAVVWLLAGLGVYLLVRGFSKSKQQAYLNTAGTDKATQQAQALRDAFNKSGISYLMAFDGTDTDLVFQTAAQITDYAAVSDSYRVLYPGSELTNDLQTELSRTDLQRFWDIVYKRGSNPTAPTTPTATGKQVKATQTVNVRVYSKPTVVEKQAKAGEIIGTYVGDEYLTINGTKSLFVVVTVPAFLGLYTLKYYVLKSAITLV